MELSDISANFLLQQAASQSVTGQNKNITFMPGYGCQKMRVNECDW